MKWHLGLLDDDPRQNRSYQWMMRRGWFKKGFPADVREELAIWFAMPGFSVRYHLHNLKMHDREFYRAKTEWPGYDQLQGQVHENWLSITRQDAIKLCHLRPGGSGFIPLVSQLAILDEIKAGRSQASTSRLFGVSLPTISSIKNRGLTWSGPLPEGFSLLVAKN